jgi:hypothetical protein
MKTKKNEKKINLLLFMSKTFVGLQNQNGKQPQKPQKTPIMTTTINFFEGSYCFNSISTDLNVSPDFIEMKLAKQYEYRPTTETLWAIITQNSIEIGRFKLIYGVGLNEIKFN